MKQFQWLVLMMVLSPIASAATPTKAVVRAVSEEHRNPLDYERAFDAVHWQFTIHQHSVHSVYVTLYLDGKELLTTGLSEQRAHSSKPHTFDIAISPIMGSLLVNDKWAVWLSLRSQASFTYIIPRPRDTNSMAWEGEPAPRAIAPNRFELARFYRKSDTKQRQPRRLTLQIRINED